MVALNLPTYPFKIKKGEGRDLIFDIARRKWVALTPEEWVRQHVLNFLVHEKGFPLSLITTEMALDRNARSMRSDIVCFNRLGEPLMLVECKAPDVKISRDTLVQASLYYRALEVPYVLISNGLTHCCFLVDFATSTASYLSSIPSFLELVGD